MFRKVLFFCLLLIIVAGQANTARAEKRVALIVGNSEYQNVARLDNPTSDASLMAGTLKELGFILIGGEAQLDLKKAELDLAVQKFGRELQGADVALFYYAGHGVQVRGSNYLVPINANPTREADVDFQMVDVNLVMNQMQGSGTRLNLVILDACRNNPFGGRGLRSSEGGLAQIRAPEGSLISYATQPGNVAQDGTDGHSPYTKALAATIKRSGLDIFQTFNEVGLAVKRATGGSQQPWVSSSPIDGNFYFSNKGATASLSPAVPQPETRRPDVPDRLLRDVQTDCDRLAASPVDEQRPRSLRGVQTAEIDIVPALAACDAAMRDHPDVARFAFQAGRIAYKQKDFGRARELFERAADKGSLVSANNLGAIYKDGNGVPKDYATARTWFEKAAREGLPLAMANLGSIHRYGRGVAVDFVEARKWYERAAAGNDPLGMLELGILYQLGNGVEKDIGKARKWYDSAAAQGSTGAMVNIGNLYREGIGTPQDFSEARKWYDKATQAPEPNGMAFNNIGLMYVLGQGTTKDYSEARKRYEKASAMGIQLATANLAYLYRDGLGVRKDLAEARKLFEKAAAAGEPAAMNGLGYMLQADLKYDEARKWYEKAAALGNSPAMANMGILYRDGRGVTKDYAEAMKWFEKSAAAGRAFAMISLGKMYQDGQGVAKDQDQARKWYEMAAATGDESAKASLKQFNAGKK